jgi:hypothetical protein
VSVGVGARAPHSPLAKLAGHAGIQKRVSNVHHLAATGAVEGTMAVTLLRQQYACGAAAALASCGTPTNAAAASWRGPVGASLSRRVLIYGPRQAAQGWGGAPAV